MLFIKTFFKTILKAIKTFFKTNKEITSVLGISGFLFFFVEILNLAGIGISYPWTVILQKITFAIFSVGIFVVASLTLIKGFNPKLRDLVDRNNIKQFKELTLWQKYILSFGFLALLFWGMVSLASNL